MGIKLKLEGFDELVKKIEEAGGNVDNACKSALSASAKIMQDELKSEMQRANVPHELIKSMPSFEIESRPTYTVARVGYQKGTYNPRNPSNAYKVVFLNYGTPHRTKHGKVVARGFIQRAKRKAKPKIKKEQETALNTILGRLRQ